MNLAPCLSTQEHHPSALALWLADLLHGPVVSNGDYFDRLLVSVESSAPVTRTCG